MKKKLYMRVAQVLAAAAFLLAGGTGTFSALAAPAQGEAAASNSNLSRWCGSFSYVEPGPSFNYVYLLELDPEYKTATWEDAGINNSIGYAGTEISWPEHWNIMNFNLGDNGRDAMARMINMDTNAVCTVKLTLDSYGNIKMSYVSGNSCPGVLLDSDGGHCSVTFQRD